MQYSHLQIKYFVFEERLRSSYLESNSLTKTQLMKLINNTLPIIFLFVLTSLTAQNGFEIVYGDGTEGTRGEDIITTSDNGYLAAGIVYEENPISPDDIIRKGVVLKLDTDGEIIWETLLTFGTDLNEAYFAQEISDGYLIMGMTKDTMLFANGTTGLQACHYLAKLDFDGNLLWTKNYTNYFGFFAKPVQIDGGYVTSLLISSGDWTFSLKILKLDEEGNVTEEFDYPELESSMIGHISEIKILADGNYLITTILDAGTAALKFSPQGNLLWRTDFNITSIATNVHEFPNGQLSIFTFSPLGNAIAVGTGFIDHHFILEVDGSLVSSIIIDDELADSFYDQIFLDDETLFSIGRVNPSDEAALIKMNINATGGIDTIFTQYFTGPDSLTSVGFHKIDKTHDDHVIIIGHGYKLAPNNPDIVLGTYLYILKLNTDGEVITSSLIPIENSQVQVFPNPTTDLIYIKGLKENEEINIVDFSARALLHKKVTSDERLEIDMTHFNSGTYFLNILSENKTKTIKVIKN